MDIENLYKLYEQHPSIQTDTRKLKPGDIFVALKGPHFNGNEYVQQAFEKGAVYCITDEPLDISHERIIVTNDCLQTLQQLAKKHREQFNIPFLAITGSNGKTTTKELVHAVLSTTFKTYTTEGNLNNHIGIPLTILKIKKDAAIAIVEMGANHQKEIESYCLYALPTHGLITNCGKAHLEGFGGEEGVRKGKGELFDYLRENNGTAFVFSDYGYLLDMCQGIKNVIQYGSSKGTVTGSIHKDAHLLEVAVTGGMDPVLINTQLVGGYNLPNVLAAVCIGKHFGVPERNIKSALESYQPSNSRSQLISKNGNTIILDAYNANPSSMKVAIENFAQMPGTKKVLMLGAMMELGNESEAEHFHLVKLIHGYQWEKVVLVGQSFGNLPGDHLFFTDAGNAANWFKEQGYKDALILVKGSRSMQMEKVLE